MSIIKALHAGLKLLQLKLTLTKEEQLAKIQNLSTMCSRALQELSFCNRVHDLQSSYGRTLDFVIDSNRNVSLLVFFGSSFKDGSLLAGELSWFFLKIVRTTEVFKNRINLCPTDELLEGDCAIEVAF